MDVITFDPGITTGIVQARITDTLVTVRPSQAKLTPLQLWKWIQDEVRAGMVKPLLICEDFELRPNKREGIIFYSAYLIGVLMAFSEHTAIELRMQSPAYGEGGFYKGMGNLKAAGVYVGGDPYHHAMSAMRHFMQWYNYGPGYKYNKKQEVVLVK